MASIFASPQAHNGSFRADKLQMAIDGNSIAGKLVQNVQFSFSQQLSLLYEINGTSSNTSFVYYVGGRAQGQATIARIIGPAASQLNFVTSFGDVCSPKDITFNARAGCDTGAGIVYTLKKAVLTTVADSVNANDVVINEQLTLQFLDLDAA